MKEDFSILKCDNCCNYLVLANNAMLDINHEELIDLRKSLIQILENNPVEIHTKYLISVAGFKKMQLCLSYSELNTMISLLHEALIILEAKNILSN